MYRKLFIVILTSVLLVGCTAGGVSNEKTSNTGSTAQQSTPTVDTNNNSKVNKYSQAPAELPADQLTGKKATIHTAKGDIEIELFGADAPKTVSNFMFLANDHFYDNLTFHRREEGFVIQGGDPAGNGTGGPGYNVPAEINAHQHVRGAVAMARLGDDVNPTRESSGSQFYICLADSHFLDGNYTVFGQVTKGMEVADQIQVGDNILSVSITNQ